MFYSVEAEDRIRISLLGKEREKEVFEELKRKYVGRILEDASICVLVTRVVGVHEYKVHDECLIAKVGFEMLLFKLFKDEVACGQITEQNEEGIGLGVSFFDELRVRREDLPAVCEKVHVNDGGERRLAWAWVYKGSKLYFRRGAEARFRVLDGDRGSAAVLCDFSETGLGPLEWWV